MYTNKEKDGGDKTPNELDNEDDSLFFEEIGTGETGTINI